MKRDHLPDSCCQLHAGAIRDKITLPDGIRVTFAVLVIFRDAAVNICIYIGHESLLSVLEFPCKKLPQNDAQTIGFFTAGTIETQNLRLFCSKPAI
jgi:hypothetical protein